MRIVLIGAGSGSFGRGQIADILQSDDLRGRDVTLALVDTNEAALDRMARVAERIKQHTGSDVDIEATTDRCEALAGADFVTLAVTVKRYELWEQDYRVPMSYGFAHVLGECGGPGAMFHALRNFELVIPVCRDIERLCPDALLLNFTNPEARVLHAITHLTSVRAAGLCHGVFTAIETLSQLLDRPADELDIVSAGMNHFYCALKCVDRASGEDLLGRAIELAAAQDSPHQQLFQHFASIFDVFIFPSDDHIGEYVSFGSEFHGKQWPYGLESRKVRRVDEPFHDYLAEYAAGDRPADDPAVLAPSGESAVGVICDVALDRGGLHPAVNVLNDDGYVANLPRGAVVEVPGLADAAGLHPLHVGDVPETMAAIMRPQFTIHDLLTEAYRTHSRKLLLQALLLDPLVDSITRAEKMLDQMLALQSEFLPTFA